jgi:cell division septal protein FtsQ
MFQTKRKNNYFKNQTRNIRCAPRIYPGSRRTAPRQRWIFFQKSVFWFLALILLIFVIWLIFFAPFFRIKEILIIGNEATSSEKIKNEVNQIIQKRAFFVLPKDNIIFIKPAEIEKALEQENPSFQKIEAEKKFPNILKIEILERRSAIIWCRRENCFFTDKNGIAYAEVFSAELTPFGEKENIEKMLVVQEEKEGEIKISQKVADQNFIGFILEISKNLKQIENLEIISLRTPESASLEIWITTTGGWQAVFNASEPAKKQAGNLAKFLSEKISEEERKNLEYIDLRIPEKIYYK